MIAVSNFIKQQLQEEYHLSENKIVVIPRGADTNLFNPDSVGPDKVQAFLTQHNIPLDKPIITLVGRLSRIKGHSVVLQAIRLMRHQEVTLLFVGGNPKGDYEKELQAEMAQLPEEATVRIFAVSGKEMPVVYAASDIFVQPSLVPESFGRSIAEGQAMQRVVVAAAHGGAVELIQDGKTGFLTPVGDAESLAKTLDKVLEMSPKVRAEMGKAASTSVHTHFTTQKMCAKTLALYREFLGN